MDFSKKYKIVWVIEETEAQGETDEPLSLPLAMAWLQFLQNLNDGVRYGIVELETGEVVA